MNLKDNTLLKGDTYRIIRFISSGGFGCTYEAEHVMLQKRVAIKEFFVRDFCNRDSETSRVSIGTESKRALVQKLRTKFVEEARALCRLSHPGIVHVFDVFEENGTAYFVMDYVEGRSLGDIVDERGPLPEDEALGYIHQVCDAMKYVHAHNRLHLDFKPDNVMVDANGRAVLIDFGASKQYDEASGENTSTVIGLTPGYAPPEQMGNEVVKFMAATDIYAIGATLYTLLTGLTPPSASQRIAGEPLRPYERPVSEATRNLIEWSLRLNKSERPQSIDEMLTETPPAPTPVTQIGNFHRYNTPEPEPKKSNGLKLALIGVGVAVVAFIVAFAIFSNKGSEGAEEETVVVAGDTVKSVKDAEVMTVLGLSKYTGTIDAQGLPHGRGLATWDSGDSFSYDGEWVHGKMEGETTYKLRAGDSFTGTFKDNRYDTGVYTVGSTGEYFKGSFKNGQPDKGDWYDKDGNILK